MEANLIPIRGWAKDSQLRGMSQNILQSTLQLAKGQLSIVIGLLESMADEGSFKDMMRRCGTLREIDTLT
jgi:hypothetical protein